MFLEVVVLSLILLFNVFVILSLALTSTRRKSKNRKFFVWVNMGVAVWVITILITDYFYDRIIISLWASRLSFFMSIFISLTYYYFIDSFRTQTSKSKLTTRVLEILSLIIGVISLTTLNVEKVTVVGKDVLESSFGPLYIVVSLYVSVIFLYATILFFNIYQKQKNRALKSRIRNILFGATLSITAALVTNIFLPMLGFPEIRYLGPVTLVFFLFFTYYAILLQRFLNVKMIFVQIGAILVFALITYGAFHLVYYVQTKLWGSVLDPRALLTGLVIAVLFVFLLFVIYKWITKRINKGFIGGRYTPTIERDNFLTAIGQDLDVRSLIQKIEQVISRTVRPYCIGIVVVDPKNGEGIISDLYNIEVGDLWKNKILEAFSNGKCKQSSVYIDEVYLQYDSIDNVDDSSLRWISNEMGKKSIAAIYQLRSGENFYGVLFIGDKEEGVAYEVRDIELIDFIVENSVIALSRAMLYNEVSVFNQTLVGEVEKATKDLQKANEDLKDLDKAKDDLIAIASHELRTPASIVKGKLHLLKGRLEKIEGCEGYDPKIDEDVDVCLSAIEREIEQVNTLLEASRIGKDTMKLEKQEYDLVGIVTQAVEDFQETAKRKGLSLRMDNVEGKMPKSLLDVKRIREVIDNLITNAIKYTESGGIIISVYKSNKDKSICTSVKDTGLGIPEDEINNLFSKFYRVKRDDGLKSKLVKPGGTGLGLFVAKNIVEKHKGKIWVESEDGKGSAFTFCIPTK